MSVNLEQIEALAKAATEGPWTNRDSQRLREYFTPAVVLQWVAETRALRQQLASEIKAHAQDHFFDGADKLRVAVEALEWVEENASLPFAHIAIIKSINQKARTALDEIKKLSGGQGER